MTLAVGRLAAGLVAAVPGVFWTGGPASAQPFPVKSLRIVVPFPPGGTSDILSRLVGQKMTDDWGQPVITDNRPGASGNIAAEYVAKQRGDGYVLFINTVGTHAINPAIFPKLGFDPIRDFTPISNLVNLPSILLVHPSVPARTVKELVALAKKRPGELLYSSAGSGSQPHLSAELFRGATGIQIQHVPYKGAAQQMTDLIAGHVALTMATAPSGVPLAKAGQARALAVTSANRIPALPDTPTVAESGYPGFLAIGWNGIVGPAGIPQPVLERIHAQIVRIMQMADVRERLIGLGAEPVWTTPEEFAALMKSEIARWAKVVKESGARLD